MPPDPRRRSRQFSTFPGRSRADVPPMCPASRVTLGHALSVADEREALADLIARLSGSDRASELALRLGQSLEITDGLWELVPVVVAAGKAHDQRSPAEVADNSPAGLALGDEERRRLRELADDFSQAMDTAAGISDESALDRVTVTQVMTDPFGTLGGLFDMPAYGARVVSDPRFTELVAGLSSDSANERSYLIAYMQASMRSPRTPVLLRALFVTAVGSVEPLISRYVTLLLFDAEPGVYTSLADSSLEKKARELRGGGPASWRTALTETLGIGTVADAVDWPRLEHLWEQRNVIVHRGGVGDARYARKTGGQVGDVPAADPAQVQAAIDEIGAARFGLAAAVWHHIMPDLGEVISGGTYLPFCASLEAGRWRQAAGIAQVEATFATDAEDAAGAKVNRWLALDKGHGPEAIKAEVEAWDLTGLSDVYRMAQHVLLHRDDDGLTLLRNLIADGTISGSQLESWPLLKRLRDEGKFSNLPQASSRA